MVFQTREKVNKAAGSRRMLAHYTITPGQPGWLEGIDRGIETYKPDGWKGYTDRRQHPQGHRRTIPGGSTTRS